MIKALEEINKVENSVSFLDLFQYQVDTDGQLRLQLVKTACLSTTAVHPVSDIWPSHCATAE